MLKLHSSHSQLPNHLAFHRRQYPSQQHPHLRFHRHHHHLNYNLHLRPHLGLLNQQGRPYHHQIHLRKCFLQGPHHKELYYRFHQNQKNHTLACCTALHFLHPNHLLELFHSTKHHYQELSQLHYYPNLTASCKCILEDWTFHLHLDLQQPRHHLHLKVGQVHISIPIHLEGRHYLSLGHLVINLVKIPNHKLDHRRLGLLLKMLERP